MSKPKILDLETQFASYGAYHSNPTNILIHTIFVWPILFTTLVILHFTPYKNLEFLPTWLGLDVGFVLSLVYGMFYVGFDKKAGTLAALLCFGCWVGAGVVASQLGFSLAWKVVLAAQLFCWTGQFIGHGVFEKRAPALLDNLAQAFLMAPFFVLLEVLQILFRYEPYPGFHASVKSKIDAEINEWQEKKRKKLS